MDAGPINQTNPMKIDVTRENIEAGLEGDCRCCPVALALRRYGLALEPKWDRLNGTHQVGFHDQRGKARNKPTLGRREANATPVEFARYLTALATACSPP